ncbi:phosphoadenosine phosphosulfate reductase [Novosphingobium marinum]|uniref:Adenosine 5'-phosphosulfate reductase n=1 Tax=Novosphingobium marinum TaxID=1514948 RepID=A0A7Y9XYB5_9SPHN|nr:phosphoadenylyl-sulfate reductase [Novosphingobium marinum]NYH95266.1 phosphoadenosine phosphosulfate reductase [Novosphingobium marinum]GGC25665.1 phosphoadenosine phosphosulfate reductase [Novosphingobium marinum]
MPEAAARIADRIDTGPRFTGADVETLNRRFEGVGTRDLIAAVVREGLAGDIAVVSSFGAESSVLLHLVASVDPSVPVLFLETGKHFAETLAYRDTIERRLGLTDLRNLRPDEADIARRDETGLRWSYDPDGCCEIRKVRPLAAALAGFDASFTGRKAFQSETRANIARFELDTSDTQGRIKVNPLADWSADDLAAYMAEHDLPAHPLVAEGYPSIGCSPCTSKVAPGEDPRSGRWRGWDKTECGIHVPGQDGDEGDLPPGYEPAF